MQNIIISLVNNFSNILFAPPPNSVIHTLVTTLPTHNTNAKIIFYSLLYTIKLNLLHFCLSTKIHQFLLHPTLTLVSARPFHTHTHTYLFHLVTSADLFTHVDMYPVSRKGRGKRCDTSGRFSRQKL